MSERRFGRSVSAVTGEGRGRLLASVATGWFLIQGMRIAIPGILPAITDGFGATDSQAGLAITVLWATYALMQFPAGFYSDRLDERVLMVAGLLISAGGLVAYTVTPTFALFVVATAIFGFGTGIYGPPRGTVVSKTYDENDGTAFGLMRAAGSVGAAVLPVVAAAMVVEFGWRPTVSSATPAFLLAALGVWWAVPATHTDSEQTDSLGNTLRGAIGAVRDVRIGIAGAGAILMLFVFQAATAFLTTYLVDIKGLSQETAGSVLGLLFILGAGFQWFGGGFADRYGAPRVLTAISVVSIIPLLVLPSVEGILPVTVVSALIGIQMSIGPILNAYIIDLLPGPVQGTAWGAIRTVFFFVGALGSTLVGVMADAGLFDAAFYLLAVLTAAGAGVYYVLPERS